MVLRKMPIALISKDEIDLEDGEIEDDEEEPVKTPAPTPTPTPAPAAPPKKPPPPKLEPPIIEASAVDSAKLLVTKNKDAKVKEAKVKGAKESKKHSKKHSKAGKHSSIAAKAKPNSLELEDDWADNVEKAIRAAMGKDPSAVATEAKGSRREEAMPHRFSAAVPPEFGVEEDRGAELSGEDKKSRKKKRKKRHRDEDGEERKESKRRKKHHHKEDAEVGPEGEDDDEMLFVRGASPVNVYRGGDKRHASGSPPPPAYHDDPYLYPDDVSGQGFEDQYESYDDDSELDDYLHEMDGPRRGGRGGGIKRRGRGAIRGMRGKGGIRPRENMLALKKRKRMLMQRHPDQRPDSVCMFFMQGKCQKGDDCPYSHDALPPRKMELCKFYLMDCCAKKDKCLYMHHDFPCKFHHTGLKCYAGDRCKFSHGQLNDILKNILLRHLETAPKEILGDFPRLSREGAAAMVHNKKTRDHSTTSASAAAAAAASGKPIPSLFDIEVPVPAQFMPDGSSPARKTTPMPSDNEDQDVNADHSPTSKAEPRSPSKRHKNRWDDSEETNDKPSRHDQNKQHWDEEIRKHQEHQQVDEEDDDGRWNVDPKQRNDVADNRWNNNERKRRNDGDNHWSESKQQQLQQQQKHDEEDSRWNEGRQREDASDNRWNEKRQRDEGDDRWNEKRQRDEGEDRWGENRQREDEGDGRWNNDSKMRDDGEKKKRRGDKEKKPRWEEGKESRRRENLDDRREEKRKWESEERKSKKRGMKEKSDSYAELEGYGDEPDQPKSGGVRGYKEGRDDGSSQSQRLLRLAGYAGPRLDPPPRPLDLDTDGEDRDELVMDVDEHDSTNDLDRSRKESVDDAALVIDTTLEEEGGGRGGDDEENKEADSMGDISDAPVIPLHIQKLPKKQQELFLRIQQQQREQQNNQGSSATDDKEEDRQDESWYSSDEDETAETSLSDVLKKLSATKVTAEPDPDLAKKVTDLTKVPDVSDAVNKLLSSIGMRTTQPDSKTDKQKPSSTLPTLPLPPLPLPAAAAGPRDPRLSRDPRNRQGSGETRTSQDSPTPGGSSSSSSSRVDPRARRRSSTSRSIYDSISLSGPEKPSDSPLGRGDTDLRSLLPTPRDVDLRPTSTKDLDLRTGYGDLDFRVGPDPRGTMSPLASSILTAKTDPEVGADMDLRRMLGGLPFKPVPQHTAATEIDASLNSHPPIPYRVAVVTIPTPDYSRLKVSSTDQLVRVDPRLRKLFKITSSSPASPPPVAPSLVSPTPSGGSTPSIRVDPRRLASQSRSSLPDSQLDQGQSDASSYPPPSQQQRNANDASNADPFASPGHLNQQGQYVRNELMTNPMLLQQQMLPTMGHGMQQGMDPRMFRNAPQTPGLLGDAPPYYPPGNMPPHYDDDDNGNISDTDQRSYYPPGKRMGGTMEMQEWEQQQMMDEHHHHSYRNNPPRGNWRGHPRRMHNSRYQYDKRNVNRSNRSYTPPQM